MLTFSCIYQPNTIVKEKFLSQTKDSQMFKSAFIAAAVVVAPTLALAQANAPASTSPSAVSTPAVPVSKPAVDATKKETTDKKAPVTTTAPAAKSTDAVKKN